MLLFSLKNLVISLEDPIPYIGEDIIEVKLSPCEFLKSLFLRVFTVEYLSRVNLYGIDLIVLKPAQLNLRLKSDHPLLPDPQICFLYLLRWFAFGYLLLTPSLIKYLVLRNMRDICIVDLLN